MYFTDIFSECDVLKVDFFPQQVPFPAIMNHNYLRQTAEDILHLLQDTRPSHLLNPIPFGVPILNAFSEVAKLLVCAVSNPATFIPADRVTTPLPVPAPRVTPLVSAPPRVIFPYSLLSQRTFSPTPTSIPPTSQQPVLIPRVPFPFYPALNHGMPSTSNYTPSNYLPLSPPAQHPNFGTHNPLHCINSAHHDPTISGKMYNPVTGSVKKIDSLLAGDDAIIWRTLLTNKLGRCAQGVSKQHPPDTTITGTQTIFFIKPHQVTVGRKVTSANFVCTMRPNKAKVYRFCMAVGGDKLDANQDVCSPAVGITDTKIHNNSTISDTHHGACYCTGDLKDFFLCYTMHIYRYMCLHRRYITQ